MASRKMLKSAIESMMFIWGEPLEVKDIADVFNIDKKEALECCRELMEEYEQEGRGIVIRQVNKAFQFTTRAENLPYIERLCTPTRHRRLSQSALETLAIVAYRQPVTKGEIESIRGIRCDRVMEGLAKKGLVREVGRAETVGRPILYGTTDEFLKQFGFETIKDLPEIQDIEGLLEEAPEDEREAQDSVALQQISLEDLSAEEGSLVQEDAPEREELTAQEEAPEREKPAAQEDAPEQEKLEVQEEAPEQEKPAAQGDAPEQEKPAVQEEAPEQEKPAAQGDAPEQENSSAEEDAPAKEADAGAPEPTAASGSQE